MEESTGMNLTRYNQLWMELDDFYSDYATRSGLPACAFWIFYTLYESSERYTQKDLAAQWSLSRQTINSALKNLALQGLVEIVPLPGQKKNKEILLTEEGKALARKIILPIMEAERNAFGDLSEKEQEMLLRLTGKYIKALQAEI